MDTTSLPTWLDRDAYPFRTRRVRVRDGELNLVDEGSGSPMLFVHGTPTWSFEYRHLLRAFRGSHRVLAPDHLGFGLSDRPESAEYSPEAHAARFAELADSLDLRDVTLVVHDFGGPIGLPWAAANPDRIRHVVYFNTFAWPVKDESTRSGAKLLGSWFGKLLYRFCNVSLRVILPTAYGDRARLTPAIHAQYLAPFARPSSRSLVLHALARGLLGSERFYETLSRAMDSVLRRLPSTIVWGMRDPAFGATYLAELHRRLPSAEVVEVVDAGHWPHEESPADVISAITHRVAKSRAFLPIDANPKSMP